ncbi:AAA family ATPase, partial [Mycobacterium tuberculosis]|nr:AAA family ATPase [Mycobacterium tuberculosis]
EGQSGMLLRMRAWRDAKGDGTPAPFALIPASVNLFDNETGADELVADLAQLSARAGQPLRLIVLDTLSRMIGSGDEDRAHDINVVV